MSRWGSLFVVVCVIIVIVAICWLGTGDAGAMQAGAVTVSNGASAPVLALAAGYNLIGWPLTWSLPISQALTGCFPYVTSAMEYDWNDVADPWGKYVPTAPPFLNDLTVFQFGHGYHVEVSQPCTLTFGFVQ